MSGRLNYLTWSPLSSQVYVYSATRMRGAAYKLLLYGACVVSQLRVDFSSQNAPTPSPHKKSCACTHLSSSNN